MNTAARRLNSLDFDSFGTMEAATQQRQSERVLNMGSAGDSPAPVGPSSVAGLLRRVDDSPTGTAPSHFANRPFSLHRSVVSVPSCGSPVCVRRTGRPDGTGG